MDGVRRTLLRRVMNEARTTQTELARISGVHQPSISQFLSGTIEMSDAQLDRLLSCMGYRLDVVHSATPAVLTRAERRSWLLHRALARRLASSTLEDWLPAVRSNIRRIEGRVQGVPHESNVRRWKVLIDSGDVAGLRRVLTGLDRDAIDMREVSPLGGLLDDGERAEILHGAQ